MPSIAQRLQKNLNRSRIFLFALGIPVLAFDITNLPNSFLRILYIVLGFSLIIFLHELGHFLVARACSVKCLAFSLGIGPRMFGWRKGTKITFGSDPYDADKTPKSTTNEKTSGEREDDKYVLKSTEPAKHTINPNESDLQTTAREPHHPAAVGDCDYRLSWLPLGGYVRMLGQDYMDPTKISTDPHAFNRRPIWQRMCIVSAGVIMNLIFAAVCFSIIFHPAVGVEFPPAIIGQVVYDSQAWKAGLRPGDEVLSINNKPFRGFLEFTDIQMETALSDGINPVHFKVKHRDGTITEDLPILPLRSPDTGLLSIGVASLPGVKIGGGGKEYVNPEIDAALKHDSLYAKNRDNLLKLQDRDIITAVDGTPIDAQYLKLDDKLQLTNGNPVKLTLTHADGTVAADAITLYPHLEPLSGVSNFPKVLGLEPTVLVPADPKSGTPAAKAGIKEGDHIVRVGDKTNPSVQDVIRIISNRGTDPVEVAIERAGEPAPLIKTITPKKVGTVSQIGVSMAPDFEHLRFIPPAAETQLGEMNVPADATIAAIDGTPVADWQDFYAVLRTKSADSNVKVTFKTAKGDEEHELKFSKEDHDTVTGLMHYRLGLSLENKVLTQRAANAGEAVLMGMDHTKKFIVQVYLTLYGLSRGTVSPDNLHGIVGITKIGYDVQDRGIVWLWYVLAMVSVNLAVANFLPLPIVDGGLFLLLILEKVRGRPLSLKVQSAIQMAGIILLAGLFLYVTKNDIMMFLPK